MCFRTLKRVDFPARLGFSFVVVGPETHVTSFLSPLVRVRRVRVFSQPEARQRQVPSNSSLFDTEKLAIESRRVSHVFLFRKREFRMDLGVVVGGQTPEARSAKTP